MNADPISSHPDEGADPEYVERFADRDLPSDRRRQLREFLMNEINEEIRTATTTDTRLRPKRRLAMATSALAVAVAVVIGVVVAGGPGRAVNEKTGPGVVAGSSTTAAPSPAAQILERAAAAADASHHTIPSLRQWIYTKERQVFSDPIMMDKGATPDRINELWQSADGKNMAQFIFGQLESSPQDNGYPALRALPTDPHALLAQLKAMSVTPPITVYGRTIQSEPVDADSYAMNAIANALDDFDFALPPAVAAAMWRAVALLPRLGQPESIGLAGRPVIAIGRESLDPLEAVQLLIDARTYEFVGVRYVAIKDISVVDPKGQTITDRAGTVTGLRVRLATGVVDTCGQRS